MTSQFDRARDSVAASERATLAAMLTVWISVAVVIFWAIATGRLYQVTVVSLGVILVTISIRYPLVPLFAFAAFIPIEELANFGTAGTISRYAGILFAIGYTIRWLPTIRPTAMPLAGWALVGWAVMSATWALDRTVTVAALGTLVQLFLIAVLVADAVIRRPTMIRPLLWAYSVSAALVAAYATVQYLSGGYSGDRVAAFADQDVAQFAAILLPVIVFATFELLARRRVVLSAGVAGICTVAVLLSGTRGAWLGLAIVFLFFVIPRLWTIISSGGTSRMIAVVLGAVVAIGIISQIPGVADQVIRRADLAVPTGGAGRTDIWTVGLTIYATSPVVGVGYGNFPVAFTPEQVRESGDVGGDVGSSRGPHSIIVGTLGELGIVGLVLLASFILPLVARPGWGADARMVQAMLVSLLTAALFLDVLNRKQVWLVLGIAGGLAFMDRVRRRNESRGVLIAAPGREDGAPRDGS